MWDDVSNKDKTFKKWACFSASVIVSLTIRKISHGNVTLAQLQCQQTPVGEKL